MDVFDDHSETFLSFVLKIFFFFVNLQAFESETSSDLLHQLVHPTRSYVPFKIYKILEKKTDIFLRMDGEYRPRQRYQPVRLRVWVCVCVCQR